MNTQAALTIAAPKPWSPPKGLNFDIALLDCEAPPSMKAELAFHNAAVGEAAEEYRRLLAEAAAVNPARATIQELLASRAKRDAAMLAGLQSLAELTRRAAAMAKLNAAAWREACETLLERQEAAEASATKLLKKLHPDDAPARLQGRLSDVGEVERARAAVADSMRQAIRSDRLAVEKARAVTAVDDELRRYCEHLVG